MLQAAVTCRLCCKYGEYVVDITKLEKWHFENDEESCNYILSLVLNGKKRATPSSLLGYQNEPLPQAGEISVITYWDGTPACVVKTTNVQIIRFCDMTYDIAKLEGENDSLEEWRETHSAFWIDEGKRKGYTFSEEMPIVFEEFEVLEILKQ